MNVNQLTTDLVTWYGDGKTGQSPTPEQWRRVLERDPDQSVTLVNLFKFKAVADYGDGYVGEPGNSAFSKYASVSMPTMARVGGSFLYVGPHQGGFIGATADWDLVAIGSYPNLQALVDLYSDEGYRQAFRHRVAACEEQAVFICGA